MRNTMRIIISIAIMMLSLSLVTADVNQEEANGLTITIQGIKGVDGQMSIGLYIDENGWTDVEKVYKGVFLEITGESISYTFSDIPLGTYAVALFHDANMNEKLDKGLFGIPKEGYAFSNNVFGFFGPPSFDKASFLFDGRKEVLIELKY